LIDLQREAEYNLNTYDKIRKGPVLYSLYS